MSRFSVTVVQQSQERLKELTNKVDGVMASGISLAEDLMVRQNLICMQTYHNKTA